MCLRGGVGFVVAGAEGDPETAASADEGSPTAERMDFSSRKGPAAAPAPHARVNIHGRPMRR